MKYTISRILMAKRTYLKSDFGDTFWTPYVEPEDPEAKKILIIHILLAGVELFPLVDVLPTHVAP
jgi:hypothetical protein